MILTLAASTIAAAAEIRLDFAGTETLPDDFAAGLTGQGKKPVWRIVKDGRGTEEILAIAETSRDETNYRFPLLIYRPTVIRDGEAAISFKAISGKVDQAAGIAFRLKDERNYYVVRANALENNVRLYRIVDGRRQQFAGRDVTVAANRWLELTLRAAGDRFEVFLDGAPLFAATDSTFPDAGRVALWTKADSLTYFRSLTISGNP